MAKGRKVRATVPVEQARKLYDQLGSWSKVAKKLRRPDGSRFTMSGIFNAVRWKDQGYAGFRT